MTLISQADFARRVGVKPPMIAKAIKNGRVVMDGKKVNLEESLITWGRNTDVSKRKQGRPRANLAEIEDGDCFAAWNTRKVKAQALKLEIENQVRKSELLEAERVKLIWTDVVLKMKSKIQSIPSMAAGLCAHKGMAEIQEILLKITNEALTEISNIPQDYK